MNYYVYAYCDCTLPEQHAGYQFSGRPFYVGYGKGNRFLHHLNEAKQILAGKSVKVYNPHKTNKICKMLRNGSEPRIVILKTDLSKDEAKAEEIRLIAEIDSLTNIAKGGEGGDTLSSHPHAGSWGETFDHRGEKNPLFGRTGANNPKTKMYLFTHESGLQYEVLGGDDFKAFVKEHHLSRNSVFDLIKNRTQSYKGFTISVSKRA